MSMNLRDCANKIEISKEGLDLRQRVLEVVKNSGRGHIGPALSILEILEVVFGSIIDVTRLKSKNPDRDRFLLSKGHGCLGLYVILEKYGLLGDLDLNTFCSFNSEFGGHPESNTVPAIEFSTGSLGHGLPVAVGMALAARLKREKWRVFVLVGDGELNEGSNWEAAAHARKHELDNLIVIVDYNDMQAYGTTNQVLDMNSLKEKWESFGFETCEINGHDLSSIKESLLTDSKKKNPKCVIAYTVKGKGIKDAENSPIWHHKAKISKEEVEKLKTGISN